MLSGYIEGENLYLSAPVSGFVAQMDVGAWRSRDGGRSCCSPWMRRRCARNATRRRRCWTQAQAQIATAQAKLAQSRASAAAAEAQADERGADLERYRERAAGQCGERVAAAGRYSCRYSRQCRGAGGRGAERCEGAGDADRRGEGAGGGAAGGAGGRYRAAGSTCAARAGGGARAGRVLPEGRVGGGEPAGGQPAAGRQGEDAVLRAGSRMWRAIGQARRCISPATAARQA